jgi:serine/threonine-protein kinase
MTLVPGTALGVYVIKSHLGSGGMGDVYCAEDTRLEREVALKLITPAFAAHPTAVARLEREAAAGIRADSPAIQE